MTLETVLARLEGTRRNGAGWLARCPAHDDKHPSLSVTQGDDGNILIHCFAGCSTATICGALGITSADLFAKRNGSPHQTRRPPKPPPKTFPTAADAVADLEQRHGTRTASWTYHDKGGSPVGLVLRWDRPDRKKDVRPVSKHGDGWQCTGMSTPRPLYNLPGLRDAPVIFITEGEKAADALAGLGFIATTSAHGSDSAKGTDWTPLAGKACIVLPDRDTPGQAYCDTVVGLLEKLSPTPTIKVVALPDLPDKGDVVDFIQARRDAGVDDDAVHCEIQSLADAAEAAEPGPRSEPVPKWKPFPTHVLPEPLRGFVASVAVAMQCDKSFVALPLLSGLASAIGNSRTIRLRRTWCEPCILWTCIVGESGTVKSPAIELALRPIRKRQRKARRRYAEAVKNYNNDLTRWKADKHCQGDEPQPPVAERCVCGDITPEALAMMLEDNPRGLLVARDELAGWLAFDRYSKARSECAFWLEIFGGRALTTDRKTVESTDIPRATASLCGGIQPGTLSRALGTEHLEDGLAARLLLAMPPRRTKRWSEADVPERTEDAVSNIFDLLFKLEPGHDPDGDPHPKPMLLTRDGKAAWIQFYDKHAKTQREHVGAMAAALAKLECYAARLALVIHLVRWAAGDSTLVSPDAVDGQSIKAAVTLVRWFGGEAGRLYSTFAQSPQEAEAAELVDWIQARGGSVTTRDLARGPRRFRGNPAAARLALEDLVEAGVGVWIEPETSKAGGRPSRRFQLGDVATCDKTPPGATVSEGYVAVASVATPESTIDTPEADTPSEPRPAFDDTTDYDLSDPEPLPTPYLENGTAPALDDEPIPMLDPMTGEVVPRDKLLAYRPGHREPDRDKNGETALERAARWRQEKTA